MSLSTTPSTARAQLGSAYLMGRDAAPASAATANRSPEDVTKPMQFSTDLQRSLAEVKGQAQFLLYLADQIEESLEQLTSESDNCQGTFLCKILGMYSSQLESRHQGLGDRIAETCQEVYVTVREYDSAD